MKRPDFRLRRPVIAIAVVLMLGSLGSCKTGPGAPSIRLSQIVREVPGADPRWQQAEAREAGVRVFRGGSEIRAVRGMRLEPGDQVETGPQAAAVIRFSPQGETVLDERTRVRVGSLEVFFGRVFANVRGLFETSSENVVAGVQGTRYLFEVRPDRAVRVAVADGVVACRSRHNAWPPFALRAHEAMFSSYPNRTAPQHTQADPREIRALEVWARQVSDAAAYGWCCDDGRVVPAWSNRCAGNFSTIESIAQAACRPAPVPDRRPPPVPTPPPPPPKPAPAPSTGPVIR